MHNGFHTINYRVADDLTAAVFVPDYELSTEKARQALPTEIPFKDAVHNVSRVSLLPAAMNPAMLASGSRQNANALLFAATQDRQHQHAWAGARHGGGEAVGAHLLDQRPGRLHRVWRRPMRAGAAPWRRPRGA